MSSTKKAKDHGRPPEARRHLSFDPLVKRIRQRAEAIPDTRARRCEFSLPDAIMSAFAMFSLKDPSLLAFDKRRNDANIRNLYQVEQVPSDTHLREMLDPVAHQQFYPMYNDVFRAIQRGKALRRFVFHEGCYLLSVDGTQYFRSEKVHCSSCLSSTDPRGKVTYSHQFLGAAIVHPDMRTVLPFAPEPIIKQDGNNKNDCERNGAKRLLERIRREHPHLPLIVVEDGLASNAPHIRLLKELNMHFLLVAKPDDHRHLFQEVTKAIDEDRYTTISWYPEDRPEVLCEIGFVLDVPLNQGNPDLRVNFLCYTEYGANAELLLQISWVTDLEITTDNACHLVRGGRARWKIENETFNTLKNQGYHVEHNFGHGKENLSVVFLMLMVLAFLIDQTQELCCGQFQAVLQKAGSRRYLWDCLRSHFRHFRFASMWHLYEVMLHDRAKELPAPGLSLHRYACCRPPPLIYPVLT